MRRFCKALFIVTFVIQLSAYSQSNNDKLLKALLNIPAPPPIEATEIEKSAKVYPKEFYRRNKVPDDDAPIEELLAYWAKQNSQVRFAGYVLKPTDIVIDRIFDEIKKKPQLILTYTQIIPPREEYLSFIKDYYDEKIAEAERLRENSENTSEDKTEQLSVKDAILAAEKSIEASEYSKNDEVLSNVYLLKQMKNWLKFNSDYYSDELLKKATKIKDRNDYVNSKDELIALAKYDWKKAEPIAERLIDDKTQPASSAAAKWAYYTHYLQEDDELNAEKYRQMLKDIVADKKASNGVRDLALDALVVEKEFEGRDEWYISLLEDETLYNLGSYTGLKTFMDVSTPEVWVPKMLELVGHQNKSVHNASVRNLVNFVDKVDKNLEKQILTTLIPWLADSNWAIEDQSERSKLMRYYARLDMPEVIPALIQIVMTESPSSLASNALKNKVDGDKTDKKSNTDTEGLSSFQEAAIDVLATFKDARAVPALLNALEQVDSFYERRDIISAIIACGGYSPSQQLNFVEKVARKVSQSDSTVSPDEVYYNYEVEGFTSDEQVGVLIVSMDEPSDEIVRLIIERIKVIKTKEPKIADTLNIFLQRWKSKVLDIERLNLVSSNNADLETIIQVIVERAKFRKEHSAQIASMRGDNGIASGIAACLSENVSEVLSATNSSDLNTQISALACARLIRLKLPVSNIGQLLNSSNPILALASERYLTSEDSFEARRMVLAKHPGEAKILGARLSFSPKKAEKLNEVLLSKLFNSVNSDLSLVDVNIQLMKKAQAKLKEEVRSNEKLVGVYAFLQNATKGHQILRIYKDKAVYTWYEDDARFRERIVDKDELNLIFDYVVDKDLENTKPSFESCEHYCPIEEFVMFGKNGGRRIFRYGYDIQSELVVMKMIFETLENGKSTLRYQLQDKIAGLEIILDDRNVKAKSLWKDGEDFRVLVLNEKKALEIEKEFTERDHVARKSLNIDDFENTREYYKLYQQMRKDLSRQALERANEPYAWRQLENTKLGEKTSAPPEDYFLNNKKQFSQIDYILPTQNKVKAKTSEFDLRTGDYFNSGIWKILPNGTATQISKGNYVNSLVASSDGKWVIATKESEVNYITSLYRINLQNNKAFKIELPRTISAEPIAYIKSLDKFLIYSAGAEIYKKMPTYIVTQMEKILDNIDFKSKKPTYYLLDANTGAFKTVKGEFKPLRHITHRNLQKTSNTDEFWAAIADKNETKIGRYNMKTFKFKEVMKIPQIKLTSMDIWVDEKDSKLYFIYEGHLLSLPFNNNSK